MEISAEKETMKYVLNYKWAKNDLKRRTLPGEEQNENHARAWLYNFDDSEIEEAERLNIILAVVNWEIEHNCISEPITDELYLYYEQFVNGELDDVIDPAEREEVGHDLTVFFNKVFPDGLED